MILNNELHIYKTKREFRILDFEIKTVRFENVN